MALALDGKPQRDPWGGGRRGRGSAAGPSGTVPDTVRPGTRPILAMACPSFTGTCAIARPATARRRGRVEEEMRLVKKKED